MQIPFQLTDDQSYFCDAPYTKKLLLLFSLIKCKHLKGQTPGILWGIYFLLFLTLSGYQILTDTFKMVNRDPANGTLN